MADDAKYLVVVVDDSNCCEQGVVGDANYFAVVAVVDDSNVEVVAVEAVCFPEVVVGSYYVEVVVDDHLDYYLRQVFLPLSFQSLLLLQLHC